MKCHRKLKSTLHETQPFKYNSCSAGHEILFSFIDSEALYHIQNIPSPDHTHPGHTLTFFPYDSF